MRVPSVTKSHSHSFIYGEFVSQSPFFKVCVKAHIYKVIGNIGFSDGKKQKGFRPLSRKIWDKPCLVLVAAHTPHTTEGKMNTTSKTVCKFRNTQQKQTALIDTNATECQDDEDMLALFKGYISHS